MEARSVVMAIILSEVVLVGGIFLIYPLIMRKGLLFGVYVGESASESEEARQITRSWYVWMIGAIVFSLAAGIAVRYAFPLPVAAAVPVFVQLSAFLVLYLRAYYQARAIAPSGPPPAAAAPLAAFPTPSTFLPKVALLLGAGLGLWALGYAWAHYADMPASVPTHFGPSGRADAWKPKSFLTVMLLPLMTLLMGVGLSGFAWLTARAKRAIRLSDQGASLEAQVRFRGAMAGFLSGTALLATLMLALMAVTSIQVGLGWRPGLPAGVMALTIVLLIYAIGGTIYLAFRYGQGGARLERARTDTPLTNGLADNRSWVLGMFYVNREDPSILVERRFGLGYTINFGNWKALLLLGVFTGIIIGICVAALLD
jgi:uncharacterized membrane protein